MMLNIVKIISTAVEKTRLKVKFTALGSADVKTSENVTPFGLESNVPKGYRGIYANTGVSGDRVLLGIIKKDITTAVGQTKLYSEDAEGAEAFYILLKEDGTAELGGNADNAARFSKLKSGFDELKDDLNDLKQKWNTFAAAYVPGSPTTVGLPPSASTSATSTASIDNAKIDEILTP